MQISQTGRTRRAHSASGDRPGFGPTPRSRRVYSGARDGRAMRTLRVTAYLLTSVASLLFIVLVVLALVSLARLGTLPALPGG